VRSALSGAAEMIDPIVQNLSNSLEEFDAGLPEVTAGFFRGAAAFAEEPSDPFVRFAAETTSVIVSVGFGALFFHWELLISIISIGSSRRVPDYAVVVSGYG
jgi:hypothetical protein